MCGVVGAIAQRNVVPILLEGLRRLEYRGYDSAGLAVVENGRLSRVRAAGRVAELTERARQTGSQGQLGIAHTRWATHGGPTEFNAHPHFSRGMVSVVHNGIIENHEVLRARLRAAGYAFESETDTEVIVHLIHQHYVRVGDIQKATQLAVAELEGAYAIGVVCAEQPDRLICARQGSPLLIGVGIEENFFASDVSALLPVTQRVIYLEDGDLAELTLLAVRVFDRHGVGVAREVHVSELSADMAELGTYRHYMQKEIHEQPKALADTLEMLGTTLQPALFGTEAAAVFEGIQSVQIIACGTSYHAGMVARYWLEQWAGLATQVEVASEYRYRDAVITPQTLLVTISQSGETADTIAALKHAQAGGLSRSLTICNVAESSLIRMSNLRFLTHAGPEIGVASTKAFTTQLAALFLLAGVLAKLRGRLDGPQEARWIEALRLVPNAVQQVVLHTEAAMQDWAHALANRRDALFLGRHVMYPVAMEGALKLKEISYIHAEAYAAGELKHGPLALVDEQMPVIVCAPHDALLDKLKSGIQEVRARGGELFVLTDAHAGVQAEPGMHVVQLPVSVPELAPILYTVPLQLLSYHTAVRKGTDVDKPRNLAKSVTVE